MELDRATLEAAHCWFDADRVVKRADVTNFKRAARWHQYQWAQRRGIRIGQHTRRGKAYANASKIEATAGNGQENFLSPAVCAAVEQRLSAPEPYQTLSEARLRYDLLSSMPMCFNLFGELVEDQARARRAAHVLWGVDGDQQVEVRFEHAPGRLRREYLGDKTAFDVALLIGDPERPRTVIGVETKYHEHAVAEKAPDPVKRMPRYREVVEASGIFKRGWEKAILGTGLQQLWRDHLLVLAMLQHESGAWTEGRYVLVHPERNPSFRDAAISYRKWLRDDSTFQVITIEGLLDTGVLHTEETGRLFRERYLF